jgi:hypothetical protein
VTIGDASGAAPATATVTVIVIVTPAMTVIRLSETNMRFSFRPRSGCRRRFRSGVLLGKAHRWVY